MRFIISKKADICFINQLQHRAMYLGDVGTPVESRATTVFTDEPLESRRKLDVVLQVSAFANGVVARLSAPIEADIALERELVGSGGTGNLRFARFGFDLDLDQDTEEFLDVLMAPVAVPLSVDEEALPVTA